MAHRPRESSRRCARAATPRRARASEAPRRRTDEAKEHQHQRHQHRRCYGRRAPILVTRRRLVQRVPPYHRVMNDRDVHHADQRQHCARAVSRLLIVVGRPQRHVTKIQKQENEAPRSGARPTPTRYPTSAGPRPTPVTSAADVNARADRRATRGNGMRNLDAPDEPDRCSDGHHDISEQRHPCARRMHVDNAKAIALLIVRRRENKPADHASRNQHARAPAEPRRRAVPRSGRSAAAIRVCESRATCVLAILTPSTDAYGGGSRKRRKRRAKANSAPSRYSGPPDRFAGHREIRGARAEYQQRHRQRQHQQRQQHTAAADPDRERRADTAEKAQVSVPISRPAAGTTSRA